MKKSCLALALMALFTATAPAHALELTVLGGFNSTSGSYDNVSPSGTTSTSGSSLAFSFGGFLQFGMWPGLSLETGLQYLSRHANFDFGAGSTSDVKFNNIMIPALLRVTALPIISFGAGPYYMFGTGQITAEGTGLVGSSTSDFDSPDSGIKKGEFGVLANVRAAFNIAPLIDAVIDGRYNISLGDRSSEPTESLNLKFKDLLFQAGISVGF